MNSLNQRLETIKPVAAPVETEPQAAVVTPATFEVRARQNSKYRKYLSRRNWKQGPTDRYRVQESDVEDTPKSWLKRLLSGWMFSLIVHFLLLLWLGTLITNFETEGPLALNFSTVHDDISDSISIDISPMDLDAVFEDDGGALDSEIVEPDPAQNLRDQLQPVIDPNMAEIIPEDFETESTSDSSIFTPVNLGTVGLDEGDKDGKDSGKGKGSKVKFFGLESIGNQFVFVIDCSGSMGHEDRYLRAVYELTRSMDMLKTNHRFLVILYNSRTYPMLGMAEEKIRLISATRTNKKRVEKWLKNQQPGNGTKPMTAMKTSLDLKPSTIYLLSDGQIHDRTINMIEQFNVDESSTGMTKIPINTISLGSSGFGAAMMKQIAERSGGRFRWVK